ncbi:tripartite tricarboxylate transporter permease [Deinococcota bacterium DY0809b]
MDVFAQLAHGFEVALAPLNLFLAFAGAFLGTLIGALPGIGPVNGVAILIPIAYALKLPPESALILLAGVYYGAEYGGRISSILLNVPGDAGAVITTLDGYPMAQKGKAGEALALSALSSFIGGTLAVIGLTLFAPYLAEWAIRFGPAEYFALMVFAFTTLASLAGKNPVKALIASVFGLMLATVGIDPGSGVPRFTFGELKLYDGVDFLVVAIGLFAISEVLTLMEHTFLGTATRVKVETALVSMKTFLGSLWTILRSSLIGFFIGVLPGAGASIASAVAYTTEKRLVDRDGTFGTGDPRGVAAPEAANNAASGGAMVPMLTLGVPGSGTTAVLLGALMMFNVTPGPLIFEQRPEIVWGLIASMYIGNVMLLVLNLPLVGWFARILTVPRWFLVPAIAALSFIGVYAVNNSAFDLLFMTGIGVVGYLMRKAGFPLAPVILGLVLGRLMEINLRRALAISGGDYTILYASPLSKVLWALALLSLLFPVIAARFGARRVPEGE